VSIDRLTAEDIPARHNSYASWLAAGDRFVDLVEVILRTVKNLQRNGLIHLDWKLRNITWHPIERRFVVIDFGETIRTYAGERKRTIAPIFGGDKPEFDRFTPLHVLQYAALKQLKSSLPSELRPRLTAILDQRREAAQDAQYN
jgi:hypothetical protein